jgi:hypothetical protein
MVKLLGKRWRRLKEGEPSKNYSLYIYLLLALLNFFTIMWNPRVHHHGFVALAAAGIVAQCSSTCGE